jgi:hypothetical protein
MARIALGGFQEKGCFVFLVIYGLFFPFNGRNLRDAFFCTGAAAVPAVNNDGGGLAVCIVEYPLDLDGRELGTSGQGLSVSVDGLTALGGPGVDGGVPGQVFDFNFNGGNGACFLVVVGSSKCLVLSVKDGMGLGLLEEINLKMLVSQNK